MAKAAFGASIRNPNIGFTFLVTCCRESKSFRKRGVAEAAPSNRELTAKHRYQPGASAWRRRRHRPAAGVRFWAIAALPPGGKPPKPCPPPRVRATTDPYARPAARRKARPARRRRAHRRSHARRD